MRFTINGLQEQGFTGFVRLGELKTNGCSIICKRPGVYVILRNTVNPPQFLPVSVGGHFKGKDPTVPVNILAHNWVDGTPVVYIGKAGGGTSAATLYSRLKQYMDFGNGKPVGHGNWRITMIYC